MSVVALTSLLLAGCGGGTGGGESGGGAYGDAQAPEAAGAQRGAALLPDSRVDPRTRPVEGRGKLPDLAPQDREIIYTASLTVRTRHVATALSEAEGIVQGAGGFVHAEHISTDSPPGNPIPAEARSRGTATDAGMTATVTLKVPPDHFRQVLDRLASDLGRLLEREQQAQDVTEKVADVESRIASAEASIDRLRTLLGEADTIGQVLQVEEKLAARESELESLQARADALADKTGYGTVTLHLEEPNKPAGGPPGDDAPTGFLAGLFAGWGAFTAVVTWLLTAFGAALPFLLVLAVLAAGAWRARGLVRARTAKTGES